MLGPGAAKVAAYDNSQGHEGGHFEIKIPGLVIGKKADDPHGEDRDQQSSPLGAQLGKAKQIDKSRDDKRATGAGKSDQDADHCTKKYLK